ncbi:hypothetical protein [Dactylosporangium cerinum]
MDGDHRVLAPPPGVREPRDLGDRLQAGEVEAVDGGARDRRDVRRPEPDVVRQGDRLDPARHRGVQGHPAVPEAEDAELVAGADHEPVRHGRPLVAGLEPPAAAGAGSGTSDRKNFGPPL